MGGICSLKHISKHLGMLLSVTNIYIKRTGSFPRNQFLLCKLRIVKSFLVAFKVVLRLVFANALQIIKVCNEFFYKSFGRGQKAEDWKRGCIKKIFGDWEIQRIKEWALRIYKLGKGLKYEREDLHELIWKSFIG